MLIRMQSCWRWKYLYAHTHGDVKDQHSFMAKIAGHQARNSSEKTVAFRVRCIERLQLQAE